MPIVNTHQYSVAPHTQTAKITQVVPLQRFVSAEHFPINYQSGVFMDDSGKPLSDTQVPEYVREQVRKTMKAPNGTALDGIYEEQTMKQCPGCGVAIPSLGFETHLISHIGPEGAGAQHSGSGEQGPEEPAPKPSRKPARRRRTSSRSRTKPQQPAAAVANGL